MPFVEKNSFTEERLSEAILEINAHQKKPSLSPNSDKDTNKVVENVTIEDEEVLSAGLSKKLNQMQYEESKQLPLSRM